MARSVLFCLGLSLLASVVHAQPAADTLRSELPPDSIDVYDSLQHALDARVSDTETTSRAAEALTRLARNPLDVNRASAADLSALPQLSPALARRIVQHRTANDPFASLDALTEISGLSRSQLRAVRPYLTVAAPPSEDAASSSPYPSPPSLETILSNIELDVLQRMTQELDPGRGFQNDSTHTTFPGSPARLTTRVRLGYERRVQLALTLDKDPGEALRWEPQTATYGFDHVAGNLALRDVGRLQTLVIGDFSAQFGQGVALWQGLSFGKGRDPVSPLIRSGRGLVPFQSTSENQFFRGVGGTAALTPDLSASAFVSRRHRDATLDSSRARPAEPIPAQTLSTGGLHRTPSELRRKNAFGLTTVGGALEYQTSTLHAGLVGYRSRFDRPLRPPSRPYRRFDVAGLQTSMVSAYATTFVGRYTLFGEVARAPSGSYGGLAGVSLDHEAGVQALLLGRRFPRRFQGLYNAAVGESGSTQNEIGVYTGIRLQITEQWRAAAYVDQYRHPWLRFSVPRPSSGIDTRGVVEYDPRPWLSTYLQVRAEREEAGTDRRGPNGRLLAAVQSERRQSVRWHTEYAFSDALTLRTRLQGSRFATESAAPAYGVLLYQGLRFRPLSSLQFDARVAFFDTDGFAARLYAYEHDLLYSFSVPVLFDRGQRSYLLAQYEPTSSLTLEAKYGVTWYPHRETIGSGLNATDGNRVRELRLQVRWQL